MKTMSFSVFAAETIKTCLNGLEVEIDGVRLNRGIEPLHRMRISTRRLRTAFRIFKNLFAKAEINGWKHDIRLLGRTLGKARELDVQIRFLDSLPGNRIKARKTFAARSILKFLKAERVKAQAQTLAALDKISETGTLDDIRRRLDTVSSAPQKANASMKTLYTQRLIRKRLKEFLGFARYVDRPEQSAKLHQMRIAAKHLRYTLEMLKPLHGTKLNRGFIHAKRFQDILGDLHECDVWLSSLPDLAEQSDVRNSDEISALEHELSGIRRRAYRRFVKHWKRTERLKVWDEFNSWA